MSVSYAEMVGRNAGFLFPDEQERLRDAAVFVCGVGGMGGVAAQTLVRAGLGTLAIADPDTFEVSNLNRQPFAYTDTLGCPKADVTRSALLRINPDLRVRVVGDWEARLAEVLPSHPVVINAMDDARAGVALYRAAREHEATVVDAYTSPCPSVFVVRPSDPRPEERLGYPTAGVPLAEITEAMLRGAFLSEVAYVAAASQGIARLDPAIVSEIVQGLRPRISFAPMVTIAGSLMAFEAIACVLGRPSAADAAGYFFDPWSGRVERPEERAS